MKEEAKNQEISKKSRLVCLLLCWLLGILGAHRFYAGRTVSAVLQILFGWATLFIWNLVDLIIVICGNFKDNEGKRIRQWLD